MSDKYMLLRKFIGSKVMVLNQLYDHFPYFRHYVEPFGGSFVVNLNLPHWWALKYIKQKRFPKLGIPLMSVGDMDKGIVAIAKMMVLNPRGILDATENMLRCQGLLDEWYKFDFDNHSLEKRQDLLIMTAVKIYTNYFIYGGMRSKKPGFHAMTNTVRHPMPEDYYSKRYIIEMKRRLKYEQIFCEDYENLIRKMLKSSERSLGNGDYGRLIPSDYFIYCDPPYMKTLERDFYFHNFDWESHERLRDILVEANELGFRFLLSYDVDKRVEKLYKDFHFKKFSVSYPVRATKVEGGGYSGKEEYLISNYEIGKKGVESMNSVWKSVFTGKRGVPIHATKGSKEIACNLVKRRASLIGIG